MSPEQACASTLRDHLNRLRTPEALIAQAESYERDAVKIETGQVEGLGEWAPLFRDNARKLREAAACA